MLNIFENFVIGICIGSFLNVVVYRLPNQIPISTSRSFCPKCKKRINWSSNIPLLSWILQKGRCKSCLESIDLKYPIIEFITGSLFVLFSTSSPYFYNFISSDIILEKYLSWILVSILLAISIIDMEYFWIPQVLINFGFLFGLINLSFVQSMIIDSSQRNFFLRGFLGALVAYFIFYILRITSKSFFKKDALGKGDQKLGALIGLWLGPMGVIISIGISYLIAASYLFILYFSKKLNKGDYIPFAPFLSAGGLVVWYFGNDFLLKIFYGI